MYTFHCTLAVCLDYSMFLVWLMLFPVISQCHWFRCRLASSVAHTYSVIHHNGFILWRSWPSASRRSMTVSLRRSSGLFFAQHVVFFWRYVDIRVALYTINLFPFTNANCNVTMEIICCHHFYPDINVKTALQDNCLFTTHHVIHEKATSSWNNPWCQSIQQTLSSM